MAYLGTYYSGDYEIIQYTVGGTIRNRLNNEIVTSYTNFWTKDNSIHPRTQEEIKYIEKKLDIKLN